MVPRRVFIYGSVAVLVGAFAPDSHAVDKVARVGILAIGYREPERQKMEVFWEAIRGRGWVNGQNILIEERPDRIPRCQPELGIARVFPCRDGRSEGGCHRDRRSTSAALAAKQATTTLPIVFTAVGNPVADGLVKSLGRPGGNASGLSVRSPELIVKSLELLKEVVPGVSRVALLLRPDSMTDRVRKDSLQAAEIAARTLGVQLHVVEARGSEDFDRAFSGMIRARAGALQVVVTPVFDSHRRRLVELAAKNHLPTVYPFKGWAEDGGLMSYGPDVADFFRRAATYVDKILKGAKPADLPVEQPTKFELVINLKTAKALELTIPPSLLARADQVIE